MSRLTDLLAQVKTKDAALGADLEAEFRVLSERRVFGLNFERHRPEAVELPQRPVRKGDKVRVLPPRDSTKRADQRLWRVLRTEAAGAGRIAHIALLAGDEARIVALDDLVVVAEFRDPIYPGLRSTGRVERGGDKPYHTVINAENYHALQTLLFTHRGKVDCIYIDPPYNTGAKDWKYNNDYVDSEDIYRHSKWLAFMERRLQLAKELLDPADSALIVAIDEKEYLRLGMLLEQIFPEAEVQMISSVIKPGGTSRSSHFSRVEEYIYFVFLGKALVQRTGDTMLLADDDHKGSVPKDSDFWEGMVRRGIGVVRSQRPKQFYPIYIDPIKQKIIGNGASLLPGEARSANSTLDNFPDNTVVVWPIKDDGSEGFWQLSPAGLDQARERGTVRVGSFNERTGQWRIQYMKARKAKYVSEGTVATLGKDENGVVIIDTDTHFYRDAPTPRTVWYKKSHDASANGAGLLNDVIPNRKFPFPKSLYAVEDCLRFFVDKKPNAVLLDFFSGSGTTAHAVMRLNRQDGGRRQCISVTNNEVAAIEQAALWQQGLRPGDPEWEQWGICDYITKPRIAAVITGLTPSGDPIKGDYKFIDEFPMAEGFEENVEFFTLTYETPWRVARNRDFTAIAPLLWLRAGAQGRRIDTVPNAGWDVAETYGVLVDLDQTGLFLRAVADAGVLRIVFIVTDDERRFQMVCAGLPEHIEPVRLYESYLANFEINTGRE